MEAYWPQNVKQTISKLSRGDASNIVNEPYYGVPNEIRSEILKDISGERIEVSSRINQSRDYRLNQNSRKLFHQTSIENFNSIRSEGRMTRGSDGGIAGNGIYFAETPGETHGKARVRGAIFSARVKLGRSKQITSSGDASITFRNLLNEGYDSVMVPRSGGTEWVVYNFDQVKDIRLL
jgi:hypothetical protein